MLPFALLLLTIGLLCLVRKQSAVSPARMFLYGWLVVFGTTTSGMIQYGHPLMTETFALVVCVLLAFLLGAHLAGRRTVAPSESFGAPRTDLDRISMFALASLAAAGAVLVAMDLAGGGASVIANFGNEAARIRNDNYAAASAGPSDSTPLQSLRFLGVVACLAIATMLPAATQQKRRMLQILAGVAALVVVADSLLSAGRFSIGVLAVCLLVSASLVYRGKVLTLRRVLIGAALGFYFFIVFPTQRNPNLEYAVHASVSRAGNARMADWVTSSDMQWLQVFAFSTSYFSASLDKLNYFLTETTAFAWYKMGAYNLPQFAPATWSATRADIARLMAARGWGPNPWASGIRDLGIDFGVFGAIVAVAILGFLAQYVYNRSLAANSYLGLMTASFVSTACVSFAFLSPFQIRAFSYGFILFGLIAVGHAILGGRRAASRARAACELPA